jgi:thermitase
MADAAVAAFDPTDGTTPVALPTQDACCQSPCDPPWRTGPSCSVYTETRTVTLPFPESPKAVSVIGRNVVITVTYTHTLCLVGKQHGGLAYTLTLLPGEKMTLFHSDRYRRSTSEEQRVSVQATFSQFLSAIHQQQHSDDSTQLDNLLDTQSQGSGSATLGVGISLPLIGTLGQGPSASTSSDTKTTVKDLDTQSVSSDFNATAQTSAQNTDMLRSVTISSYEDSDTVSTTQRTLENNNVCYAVNYFVRKVQDVYVATTRVTSVVVQLSTIGVLDPTPLTPAQIQELEKDFPGTFASTVEALPKVGDTVENPSVVAVPTEGVVYDPELAHCCAQDPELEAASMVKVAREQAEAQKVGLELQLMALEVQRRQALLAANTLDPFEPTPPAPTVVA